MRAKETWTKRLLGENDRPADNIEDHASRRDAAKETCEWLNDLYPLDHPITSERSCVAEAVEGAEAQMLAAIADYR